MLDRDTFLANLLERVQRQSHVAQDDFVVRGITRERYWYRCSASEILLELSFCIVESAGVGVAYYDLVDEPNISRDWVNADIREIVHLLPSPLRIAAVDSVAHLLHRPPSESHSLSGSCAARAIARASVIADEASRVAVPVLGRAPARVVVVGVVGSILNELATREGITVVAAVDLDQKVVGTDVAGVCVESGTRQRYGDRTLDRVSEADVAIVTGMTLVNDTLHDILRVAQDAGTKVIVFAQTGANLGAEYITQGVDVVVAEPFPFYLVPNTDSKLLVHRK